jgi:hypothetical protein
MRRSWLFAIVPAALAIGLGVFVVALLLIKVLWSWTVPDLFPGAVDQGLVARDITWLAALKLAIFMAVTAGVSRSGSNG